MQGDIRVKFWVWRDLCELGELRMLYLTVVWNRRGSWLSFTRKNWFSYSMGKVMEEQKQEGQLMPLYRWGKTGSWILILPYLFWFPCPPAGPFSLCLISYLWDIAKLIINRIWNSVEIWKIHQDLQVLDWNGAGTCCEETGIVLYLE